MNSREQLIKKWGGAAIGLLISMEFLIFPWIDWISKSMDEIAAARVFASKQAVVAAQYDEIDAQLKILDSQLEHYAGLPQLSEKEDPALLWLEVVDVAIEKVEVQVNNKTPQREVAINSTYSAFTGMINVSGDYNRILNLLSELENISKGNRVRQVSMFQPKARKGHVTANIEFVRVYKKK
ncbi:MULTISPECIES: hypothetical protein [Pseudoalteromonas]|uniref:hypothetical protein n=1 Tax=Pseudoalteromonas TaxID=53246 RepID=UPI001EF62A82|nr:MULTISPECIES: hypothetical protein [Pseudoalteromonas]MCG7538934.1 hypothetical protein [Pseudoalteromonas sp. OF7H-1]MCG9767325.1 hypothetical protein [Pseudoalteromonas piscicida]